MRQVFLLLTFSLLFISCSTILKKKTYKLGIHSNAIDAKVRVYDSTYSLPSKITVIRSKKDLDLALILDSAILNYKVRSSPHTTFLFVNLSGSLAFPINYAIDFTNNKRFYYGESVYLNIYDTTRTLLPPVRKRFHDYFSKTYFKNKGSLYLHVSLPHINSFQLTPDFEKTKINTGFWGISAGLDYYFRKDRFVSLYASGVIDFFLPVPAAVTLPEKRELMSSKYLGLSTSHRVRRFAYGYGVSYSRNNWTFSYDPIDPASEKQSVSKSNNAFGLIFPASFQLRKYLSIGLVYRPTFIRINSPDTFQYEHLISIDFAWKFRLKK